MSENNKNILTLFNKLGKKAIYSTVAFFAVIIVLLCLFAPSGETTFSVESALKEVLETSEMYTSEYTYNSIVKVKKDLKKSANEENIKYQVAYKGSVKSGFDFDKIKTVEKEKDIIVIIPKIEIKSVKVEEDLDYIFIKQKYDTEKSYAEAYNACYNDLEKKAKRNKTLYATAVDSAIETITAITKPFDKQIEEGKKIKIVYIDDYEKGDK